MNEEIYFIREDAIIIDLASKKKEDVVEIQENENNLQYFG